MYSELENEVLSIVMRARDLKKKSKQMADFVTEMAKYSEELKQPDIERDRFLFIMSYWRFVLNYITVSFESDISQEADKLDRRLIDLGTELGTPFFKHFRD